MEKDDKSTLPQGSVILRYLSSTHISQVSTSFPSFVYAYICIHIYTYTYIHNEHSQVLSGLKNGNVFPANFHPSWILLHASTQISAYSSAAVMRPVIPGLCCPFDPFFFHQHTNVQNWVLLAISKSILTELRLVHTTLTIVEGNTEDSIFNHESCRTSKQNKIPPALVAPLLHQFCMLFCQGWFKNPLLDMSTR